MKAAKKSGVKRTAAAGETQTKAGTAPPAPAPAPPPPAEEPFEDVWQRYLEEIRKGRSMRDISTDSGMPSPWAILHWARASEQRSQQYARAREDQMTLLLEQVQEVADDRSNDYVMTEKGLKFDREHVQRSKLRVDTMLTRIEKLAPKVYGTARVDLTSAGKAIGAPKRVTVEVFGQTVEL